jgi:hypothetical protein
MSSIDLSCEFFLVHLEAVQCLSHRPKPYEKTRKEKIIDLNRLNAGDHVSFYKTDLYYAHHGIVCEARTNYLRVIHYFNTLEHARTALMKGSIYIAAIIESEWTVNLTSKSEDVYLHHYDTITCYSNQETLERAFSQLGKRGYSLIGNNCEHWARWCRTGEHYSEQIIKFRSLVKEKSATLFIIDPTALLIKDISLIGVRTFGQFLNAIGSGFIFTTVESITAFIDIRKKKNERKKGSLSDVALKKYVVRRVTSASTTVRSEHNDSHTIMIIAVDCRLLAARQAPLLEQYSYLCQFLVEQSVALLEVSEGNSSVA